MPLTLTVQLSTADVTVLDNDLLDIDDWVQKAVIGKINSVKKRMVNSGITELRKDGQSVPASDDAVVAALIARPGYKNRKDRDELPDGV